MADYLLKPNAEVSKDRTNELPGHRQDDGQDKEKNNEPPRGTQETVDEVH
jgi:hypothetical protein